MSIKNITRETAVCAALAITYTNSMTRKCTVRSTPLFAMDNSYLLGKSQSFHCCDVHDLSNSIMLNTT